MKYLFFIINLLIAKQALATSTATFLPTDYNWSQASILGISLVNLEKYDEKFRRYVLPKSSNPNLDPEKLTFHVYELSEKLVPGIEYYLYIHTYKEDYDIKWDYQINKKTGKGSLLVDQDYPQIVWDIPLSEKYETHSFEVEASRGAKKGFQYIKADTIAMKKVDFVKEGDFLRPKTNNPALNIVLIKCECQNLEVWTPTEMVDEKVIGYKEYSFQKKKVPHTYLLFKNTEYRAEVLIPTYNSYKDLGKLAYDEEVKYYFWASRAKSIIRLHNNSTEYARFVLRGDGLFGYHAVVD